MQFCAIIVIAPARPGCIALPLRSRAASLESIIMSIAARRVLIVLGVLLLVVPALLVAGVALILQSESTERWVEARIGKALEREVEVEGIDLQLGWPPAINVEHLLPELRVPTLVLHSRGDQAAPFEEGRRLAARIPGARFVPLDSDNHLLLEDEPAWEVFLSEVRDFLGTTNGPTDRRE